MEGKLQAIRNKDGAFVNTQVFREAGNHFQKYGYYCPDPEESADWYDFWLEERRRLVYGYTSGGVHITGDHYGYLNYSPILKTKDGRRRGKGKVEGFPDFWDGDYNYYWVRKIARYGVFEALYEEKIDEDESILFDFLETPEKKRLKQLVKLLDSLGLEVKISHGNLNGGYHLIVGKSRRKGYSYKAGSIGAIKYFTKPKSKIFYGAYEKKFLYPDGVFTKFRDIVNHINANTPFTQFNDKVNKIDHIRASYIEKMANGAEIERGFMSEAQALTFKDNSDAGRGKDADEFLLEESGAFGSPGLLKASIKAILDTAQDGDITTGLITVFGTSGDLDGGSYDYADLFYRPGSLGFMQFINIWDKKMENTTCGYFHPVYMNLKGFYDKDGNSNQKLAIKREIEHREKMVAEGATSADIESRMQENPLNPSEAFKTVSNNIFPTYELEKRRNRVIAEGLQNLRGIPVILARDKFGKVQANLVLDGSRVPITRLRDLPKTLEGCVVRYEPPELNAPKGLYKIGFDPYRQVEGESLAAIIVYKSVLRGAVTHSIIVAEYYGRPDQPEDASRIAELLADYYNTEIMYENEVTNVKTFFTRIKRLNLLAAQPDRVISKNIKNSKVSRIFGCHMTPQLKAAGEKYIKSWLLTKLNYNEDGEVITVIDTINSLMILDALISYNRTGNFDAVSALIMCMIQVQEEELEYEHKREDESDNRFKELESLMESMYN